MPSENIECVECHGQFEFTENEQTFYAEKGYSQPKRCKECRAAKKKRFDDRERNGGSV